MKRKTVWCYGCPVTDYMNLVLVKDLVVAEVCNGLRTTNIVLSRKKVKKVRKILKDMLREME